MRNESIYKLDDCTEFRQTLMARSPRVAHATALMLVLFLAAGVVWAALAEANLIVRAPGRVRPVSVPTQVFNAASGELLGASYGNRVVKVYVREGDHVEKGDRLLELDTQKVDTEIARQEEIIATGEEEVARLSQLQDLLQEQFTSAQEKRRAELDRLDEELELAARKRDSDIRLAKAEFEHAVQEADIAEQVATKVDLLKAKLAVEQLKEKLAQAELPVEQGGIEVLRRAIDVAEKDFEVKKQELALQLAAKQGEVSAARKQLEKLRIEKRQATLRASIEGVVTKGVVSEGDVLQPGNAVFELAKEQGFLFEAGVASADIGHIRVGMPVRIKLDAYHYHQYGTLDGEVVFVAPDSVTDDEAEVPVTAYLVRVELKDDDVGRGDYYGPVKLGMSGTAEIVTGKESILTLFFQKVRQSISID